MRHPDEEGIIGARPAVDLGPLFAPPAPAAEPAPAPRAVEETQVFTADTTALSDTELQRRRERIQQALLAPLCDLAQARRNVVEGPGVTAKDARAIADRLGLSTLLGTQQRAWSWLAPWLAQLCRDGHLVKFRRHGVTMKRMGDNGNEHTIYLDPYDHRAQEAA